MTDAVIYDIELFGDGEPIDKFVCAAEPNFNSNNWLQGYKRHYPSIAIRYKELAVKYSVRGGVDD